VQAALHQQLGLALANQLHRRGSRVMTVKRDDDPRAREIDAGLLRGLFDLRHWAHEYRRDESQLRRLDRRGECRLLAGMGHCGRDRIEASAPRH
jgi:hypothetical protein